MVLSKRLQCIADFVDKGSIAADVGTDHGYIPIWLIENGICAHVAASDIHAQPLEKARENAAAHGVSDRIRFIRCPGLEAYSSTDADTIIIAGMGGETMIDILSSAPWAIEKTLVLQPQTKISELRKWLWENGYNSVDAHLVADAGRIYQVWKVKAGTKKLDENELYIDRHIIEHKDVLLHEYADALIQRHRAKIAGMEMASDADAEELASCRRELESFMRIRSELYG